MARLLRSSASFVAETARNALKNSNVELSGSNWEMNFRKSQYLRDKELDKIKQRLREVRVVPLTLSEFRVVYMRVLRDFTTATAELMGMTLQEAANHVNILSDEGVHDVWQSVPGHDSLADVIGNVYDLYLRLCAQAKVDMNKKYEQFLQDAKNKLAKQPAAT